ncbi:hypothetical protein D6833_08585 [Candidatus Parcubacteria bacterium]|nr:MAG: hypothetical protein D6833_08585 [Candidatus Parcubacteria bacterium]
MTNTTNPQRIRHYFVDEAGDGTLFSRKGQVIVGTEGCSRFFILGLLDVPDPAQLNTNVQTLRARLLADPYFRSVPSMQPQAQKTARAFHAKDDLPEIRREVFMLLRDTPSLRFFAVVADKLRVLEYVRHRNARESSYRYHPNELYDYLVRRLFRDRLHKDGGYNICFARRGRSDRTVALMTALKLARQRFYERWGVRNDAPINVVAGEPARYAGLQAVDYFLWALQRLYERGEERYVQYLWDAFRLVHDIDDTRQAPYGVYYSQRKPLTAAALEGRG